MYNVFEECLFWASIQYSQTFILKIKNFKRNTDILKILEENKSITFIYLMPINEVEAFVWFGIYSNRISPTIQKLNKIFEFDGKIEDDPEKIIIFLSTFDWNNSRAHEDILVWVEDHQQVVGTYLDFISGGDVSKLKNSWGCYNLNNQLEDFTNKNLDVIDIYNNFLRKEWPLIYKKFPDNSQDTEFLNYFYKNNLHIEVWCNFN